MTNFSTLAEQAKLILSGGRITPDGEPSPQELILCVKQAFSQLVKLSFYENKKEGESFVDGGFIYSFEDVEVTKDVNKNMFYSTLPSSTIVLPQEIGVYQISPMQDQGNFFVPLRNGDYALMQGLDVSSLEGRYGYFLEGKRVYYTFTPAEKIDTVLMKLVVAIDNIGDDELIVIPNDMQLALVQQAVQLYTAQKQMPKDISNDNIK